MAENKDGLDEQLARALGDMPPGSEEVGVLGDVLATLRGRNRFLVMFVFFFATVFAAGMFYCGYHFFTVEGAESVVRWGIGTMLCAMANMALKMWHWMEMNRISVLREVKRTELQVARLAEKLA